MSEKFVDIETKITVRYAETDQMGIAHHSNYPIWFEMGRTDLFKKIGFPYSWIESKGVLLPLTDMSCEFRKPVKYEDNIVIKTQVSNLTHTRVGFHYEIYNKDNEILLATGKTNHGWTNRELNPIVIERILPDLFQILKSSYYSNKNK